MATSKTIRKTDRKNRKLDRQLDRAETKLMKLDYKTGKKEAKVVKKVEKQFNKAGIKLKTEKGLRQRTSLMSDGKWPVPPQSKRKEPLMHRVKTSLSRKKK